MQFAYLSPSVTGRAAVMTAMKTTSLYDPASRRLLSMMHDDAASDNDERDLLKGAHVSSQRRESLTHIYPSIRPSS